MLLLQHHEATTSDEVIATGGLWKIIWNRDKKGIWNVEGGLLHYHVPLSPLGLLTTGYYNI